MRAQALKLALALAGLALSGACVSLPLSVDGTLQDQVDAIISTPPFDQVNWGIRIVDPQRGAVLYSRHSHLKFVPASNMKVLSTATALSLLGPEYRYETGLWGVGTAQEDGTRLEGDLILRASGDPTLSERFYPSPEAPLDSLANQLWASGIHTVTGALVVDVSRWDSTTVPGSWMVGNLTGASAATGGAFAIAEGVLSVEVTAGPEVGAPAKVRWWPSFSEDFVSASFVTADPADSIRDRRVGYLPESGRLELAGKIRLGEVDTIRVSQRDPVRQASGALLSALQRRGIDVQGGLRIAWEMGEPVGPGACVTGKHPQEPDPEVDVIPDCPGAVRLATLFSPPMTEVVKAILEPSQNWMTEQLVRTLGQERGEEGSWQEGFAVQREFFTEEVGVDSLDITFRDGSGLSAYNLVTPRAMVRILEYMWKSSNAGSYRNALASPGEDGTLRRRLAGLESRVFAKTGTITHVNSLSGYVFTDSGRELIFSVLTNGSGMSSTPVRAAIDRVIQVAARH